MEECLPWADQIDLSYYGEIVLTGFIDVLAILNVDHVSHNLVMIPPQRAGGLQNTLA